MGTDGGLLLLHGYFSGGVAWDGVRAALSELTPTLAPDLPGYGEARNVPAGSLEAVVDYFAPLVEREQPTHLLGHSMGGIVALALAARYGGMFERVGLTGLPVYGSREDGLRYLHRRSLKHRLFLHHDGVSHAGCRVIHATRRAWGPAAPFFAPRQPGAHAVAAFDHSREGHIDVLGAIVFAGLVEGLASQVREPVVALHGGRDPSAPLDRVRELAGRHGWDLRVAPTGNHQLPIERPGLVARWTRTNLLGDGHVERAGSDRSFTR